MEWEKKTRLFSLTDGIQSWEPDGTVIGRTRLGYPEWLFKWLLLQADSFQVTWAATAAKDSCPSSINEAFVVDDVLLCHLC